MAKHLKYRGVPELKADIVRLKTKLNMLRYYAHQQLYFCQPDPGYPPTNSQVIATNIWEQVIRKLAL